MLDSGGMPSSYSATVSALAVAIGIQEGAGSPAFAVAIVLACIVMYNAFGVRLHAGRQAELLNQIVCELPPEHPLSNIRPLRDSLGHTPLQNSISEESHLAIETSGHGAVKENHWLDDGAYLMVKILNKLASARTFGMGGGSKVLTDLIEGLQEPAFAVELRLKINQNHPDLKGGSFRAYGKAVLKHLENSIGSDPSLQKAPVNYEGVRVSGYGGWFLLRLSLHDPVFPFNIEAPSNDNAVKLGLVVLAAIKEFAGLNTSILNKFVGAS